MADQDQPPAPRGRARGRTRTNPTDVTSTSSRSTGFGTSSEAAIDDMSSVVSFPSVSVSDVASISDITDTFSAIGTEDDDVTSIAESAVSIGLNTTMSSDSTARATVASGQSGAMAREMETASHQSTSSSDGGKGLRVTRKEGFIKKGTGGEEFCVMTNYLHMNKTPNFQLHQYRVDFNPDEDSTLLKKLLVRSQEAIIGSYIFDGHMMYTTRPIPMEKRKLEAVGKEGNATFEITIRSVGYVLPSSPMYLQFYNMVMRKAITLLDMEELGRHFYDRHKSIKFEDHRLELWPGIITAIRNHDAGILLCVEVTHKVLRMAPVLEILNNLRRNYSSKEQYEAAAKKELIGTIVITHYNRRTYKIDDIDFAVTPSSTFRLQDGSATTYMDYYLKRYNVEILDDTQPMLVSYPKKKDQNKGITGNIYLIPALCNPTGLTDAMRKNYQLMAKLADHLHMGPNKRKAMLDDFVRRIKETPEVQEEFAKWDIDFIPDFIVADARRYPNEDVFMGPEGSAPVQGDRTMDWTRALKGRGMLIPENFSKWILFVPKNDFTHATNLVSQLQIAGRNISIHVEKPVKTVEYKTDLTKILRSELSSYGDNINLAFVVLPNNGLKLYADVKKMCTLDFGIASQCMLAKNMNKTDAKGKQKLGSICTKLMIQINAKTGGVPWGVKIPARRIMILGFDVYHCSERKGQSAGALVATRDQALNQYYSSVAFHTDKSELAMNLNAGMQKSLQAYRCNNQEALPDRIVLFRDGVGEGQINYVLDYEIPRLRQGIKEFYDKLGVPAAKLSVIIVTKKINSRVILAKSGIPVAFENVPPGTVVDNTITLPERYDYFLVAQCVNQGTVSPTNYNVVYDEIEWSPEKMQRLSYKLCHLYYNWCGTVAVPAPCQYAHKLAYLTGVAVNNEAPLDLATKLWYL